MVTNPYESPLGVEVDKSTRSIVRSIFGWILIGLGTFLMLRIAWLTWCWWPLREEEQNRAIVLSVLGLNLSLLGAWLRFRSLIFLLAALMIPLIGLLCLFLA